MAYDERTRVSALAGAQTVDPGLRAYMLRVYNFMAAALALSGLSAYVSLYSGLFAALAQNQLVFMIVVFAPLGLVMYLSWRIQHISAARAQTLFWLYAALVGVSLAGLLAVYTGASVARVFFITAGAFAALSFYGYTTKRDLSPMRAFLFIGLIGIILALLVNLFLQSPAFHLAISVIGVLIFAGLTAYDTQAIRQIYYQVASEVSDDGSPWGETAQKSAVIGALKLYLDFLNMFIFLLHLLGDRR